MLGLAKGGLLGGVDEGDQPVPGQLTQTVTRLDEVVAGIDAPVMLHGENAPTGPRHHAEVGRFAARDEKALEEVLHAHPLDVMADPLVEDRAEELAHRLGRDGPLRDTTVGGSLHDGKELQPPDVIF